MNTVWRPPVINEEVLRKLEEGFSYGYSDQEACLYADIWTSTFYDYCKNNPEFSERKTVLKRTNSLHAKRHLATSIKNGDMKLSIWWLEKALEKEQERKNNDMFYESDEMFD